MCACVYIYTARDSCGAAVYGGQKFLTLFSEGSSIQGSARSRYKGLDERATGMRGRGRGEKVAKEPRTEYSGVVRIAGRLSRCSSRRERLEKAQRSRGSSSASFPTGSRSHAPSHAALFHSPDVSPCSARFFFLFNW